MRIFSSLSRRLLAEIVFVLVVILLVIVLGASGCRAPWSSAKPTATRAGATPAGVKATTTSALVSRTPLATNTAAPTLTPSPTPTYTLTPTATATRVPVPITAANADGLQPVGQISTGSQPLQSVGFSPDTTRFAYGLSDGTMQLWQVGVQAPILSLKYPGNVDPRKSYSVVSLAVSPDGKSMAGGYSDNKMRLWRFAELDKIVEAGHGGPVWAVAYSRDGKLVASGAEDKNVQLRRTIDGQQQGSMGGHTAGVRSLAFSPDGSLVASGSDDRSVIIWRTADRKQVRRLPGHAESVAALAFAPNGQTLATGSDTVRLWQVSDAGLPRVLDRPQNLKGSIKGLAYSIDGQVLAAIGTNNYIALWDMSDGHLLTGISCQACGNLPILTVAFSDDGLTLVAASPSQIVWYKTQ